MKKTKYDNIKPDVILKQFWRNNERFADLFNAVLFNGEQVINPKLLMERDTDVSSVLYQDKYMQTLEKRRDVVKKSIYDTDFVILGIENQKHIHYAMPLRSMIYDALNYLAECEELARSNRKDGEFKSIDEFLSGLRKEDKIHPVITLVIYYGDTPWNGPLTLQDMMVNMPPQLQDIFCNYKMHLLWIPESNQYDFQNEEVKTVFEISREIMQGNFEKIKQQYGNKTISSELGATIGAMAGVKKIMELFTTTKGEDENMCKAWDAWEKQTFENGVQSEQKRIIMTMYQKGKSISEISECVDLSDEKVKEILQSNE